MAKNSVLDILNKVSTALLFILVLFVLFDIAYLLSKDIRDVISTTSLTNSSLRVITILIPFFVLIALCIASMVCVRIEKVIPFKLLLALMCYLLYTMFFMSIGFYTLFTYHP
jgi:hypothetical protein